MIKSLFTIAFSLLYYVAIGQNNPSRDSVSLIQEYVVNDIARMDFIKANIKRIFEIGEDIFDLPFDVCHHQTIEVEIFIDAIGMIREVNLISGGGYYNVNTKIWYTIFNYPGSWEPAMKDGLTVPIQTYLTFDAGSIYFMQLMFGASNRNASPIYNDFNNPLSGCENSEFYYNKAVVAFQEQKYSLAAKFFKKSLEYNKHDSNTRYNLGIAYVHLNKIPLACECFKIADEYDEPGAATKYKKYCSEIINSNN